MTPEIFLLLAAVNSLLENGHPAQAHALLILIMRKHPPFQGCPKRLGDFIQTININKTPAINN